MSAVPSRAFARRVIPVLLGVVVAALYVPPVVSAGLRTDLGGQLLNAQFLELSGTAFGPYALLLQVIILIRTILPFAAIATVIPGASSRQATWEISGVAATVGAAVLAAELIYFRLLAVAGASKARGYGWMQAAASVGLMVIAPITILTWSDHHLISGYLAFTVFDGSTTMFLKPFALLLFWFIVDRLDAESTETKDLWICAALSVLAWGAKASFAVVLVPALTVYVGVRAVKGRPVAWKLLTVGFLLPTVLIAIPMTAGSKDMVGPSGFPGLALAPLQIAGDALAALDQPRWAVVPFALASCAFPVAVAVVHRRRVVASGSLVLAWLVFAAGAGQYYLFRITNKEDFGDLIGGALIGLFIVYVESVRLALGAELQARGPIQGEGERSPWARRVVLGGVFALQVFCGLFLIVRDVVDPAAWW